MPDPAEEIAIVAAFLRQYADDRERGALRRLGDYQRRFPGFEAAIEREFTALSSGAAPPSEAPAGFRDRYGAASVLARGGMGVVYRVWDRELRRPVAMKVLRRRAGGGPHDLASAQRFVREARITGRLGHPGVVPVHALDRGPDGLPAFTMPIVDGRDFAQVIRELHAGPAAAAALPRAIEVLLRVCETVAYAHDRGIVHRDLKPANVMVGGYGEVYVLDWGLARSLHGAGLAVPPGEDAADDVLEPGDTLDGDVVGTPPYMPPEQARGDLAAVDARADVYAIGAILFELLTGRAPYFVAGGDNSSAAVLERVRAGPPEAPQVGPRVPPELAAVCRRAMAREPAQRYASAVELATDLRAFLEQRVVRAYEVGAVAELRKWMRRNRGVAAATAVALLALVVGFAFSVAQKLAADEQASIAAENLELALAAGDELLGRTGLIGIENEAGADPMRQELMRQALAYFTRLQGMRGDDPRVLEKIATTHFRIAQIEAQIGRSDAARAALDAAAESMRALERRVGDSDVLRHRLAAIDSQRASLQAQRGEPRQALATMARVAATLAELRRRNPDSTALLGDVANVEHGQAMVLLGGGRFDAALRHCDAEITASRRLVELAPAEGWTHAQLGWSLQLRGTILWQSGRADEADASYREAVAVLAAAHAVDPRHRGLRFRLAEVENMRGILLQADDADAAVAAFERAIALLRALTADHPGVRGYHGNLGGALCNLGSLLGRQGQQLRALELFDEALPQVRRALEIDAGAADFLHYRRTLGSEAAVAALELGDVARAAASLRAWMSEAPQESHFAAARLMALGVGLATADATLAEDCAEQAIRWLADGVRAGEVTAAMLERPEFEAVRDREEYHALRQGLAR